MRILLLLTGILIGINTAWGQKKPQTYTLNFSLLDQDNKKLKQFGLKDSYQFKDSITLDQQIKKTIYAFHGKGYIAASIDTLFIKGKEYTAYLLVGNRYEWANLKNGNVNKAYLSAIGFKERLYLNQPFYYKEVVQIQEKLLSYLENNGYPFAKVYLDSIIIDSSEIAARLYCDIGPIITLKKIKIEGKLRDPKIGKKRKRKVRIKSGFLSSYLELKEGKLYNEKQVKKIQQRIKNLRYLQTYQDPYIVFEDNTAEINLFLMDRPSSKVDVLFGLLPSQDPTTGQQRFDFTGNIHIDLVNPLGTGKHIMFKWQQIKAGTSDLVLQFEWPYVLRTPLGADLSFKLYKRDSTFLDVIGDIGIQYLFNGNSYIKAFWKPVATNLINVNTDLVLANRRLPSSLDLNTNTFGISFYYNTLDYIYNPRKGFESRIVAEFMLKQIRKNNAITSLEDPNDLSFNFESLYDSLALNTFQYRIEWSHSHFVQLWKASTLMARLEGGIVLSANPIYRNELFRIGGNKRLRGFDEESILATWYNVLTLEWRFLFGTNSYAYIFGDLAYMRDEGVGNSYDDWPIGFGVGVALETKVGIFGLSYALGAQQGNPILFQNSKVHFGYVYSF